MAVPTRFYWRKQRKCVTAGNKLDKLAHECECWVVLNDDCLDNSSASPQHCSPGLLIFGLDLVVINHLLDIFTAHPDSIDCPSNLVDETNHLIASKCDVFTWFNEGCEFVIVPEPVQVLQVIEWHGLTCCWINLFHRKVWPCDIRTVTFGPKP